MTVDVDKNQCTVQHRDGGKLYVSGTSIAAMRHATHDSAAHRYRTLTELLADAADAGRFVTRRPDLDR